MAWIETDYSLEKLGHPIHHIHKRPPCNVLFGYVYEEIHVGILPSTEKYVILGSFSGFGLIGGKIMAHSNLRHLYGKSQLGLTSLTFMFSPEFKCL